MKLTSRFPALASRDFQLFLAGQFLSVIGTWMHNTAQPYLAYRISGRPFDLGLIGFATTVPTLLLALPAGVFIEHWDKRKTVIILQSVMSLQAFGLAALTFSGHIQIWHITVLAFIFGTASAVEITARQAMLIELAGKESLPSAIALQTTAFNLGRILGPVLAAPLLASGGEGTVFLVNGVSFLFVIGGLLVARTPYQVPRETVAFKYMLLNLKSEFSEGLGFIRGNSLIRTVILMATLMGFFGLPLLQQIPALARDVLQTAQDTEAIIATRTSQVYAMQGVGALAAAFFAAYFSRNPRKGFILSVGQSIFIAALFAMSFTSNLPLALILMVLIGYGSVTQLVTMNTIIQMGVPDKLRGRVFAVYLWALQGVAPFGSLLIGGSAQGWGVPSAMLLGALVMLVSIGWLHLANPEVRRATA
ncbi:MAG: MFS transporter [Anaerolineaceae bacterium]|nr:MAG: MFS transporter [Anaerolineaceae bacterium]